MNATSAPETAMPSLAQQSPAAKPAEFDATSFRIIDLDSLPTSVPSEPALKPKTHPIVDAVNRETLIRSHASWDEWNAHWRKSLHREGHSETLTGLIRSVMNLSGLSPDEHFHRQRLLLQLADMHSFDHESKHTRDDAVFPKYIHRNKFDRSDNEYQMARELAQHALSELCLKAYGLFGGATEDAWYLDAASSIITNPPWLFYYERNDELASRAFNCVLWYFGRIVLDPLSHVGVSNICHKKSTMMGVAMIDRHQEVVNEFARQMAKQCLSGLFIKGSDSRRFRFEVNGERHKDLERSRGLPEFPLTEEAMRRAKKQAVYILHAAGHLDDMLEPDVIPQYNDIRGWNDVCSALYEILQYEIQAHFRDAKHKLPQSTLSLEQIIVDETFDWRSINPLPTVARILHLLLTARKGQEMNEGRKSPFIPTGIK